MMNNSLITISEMLLKEHEYKEVCLISHIHPDGDSLGSLLSLGLALKQIKDKNMTLALSDEIPPNFNFLPGIDLIQKIDNSKHFDLLIALDCADKDRIGVDANFLEKNVDIIMNIDHHISNTRFGDYNLIVENASSTGEIVYQLIRNINLIITPDIATCLYTAISTDTGSFKYDNASYETHLIISDLIKTGIDIGNINIELYQNRSLEKTKLFIESLNTLQLFHNNKIGIVTVTKEMFNRNNAKIQDADSIVEFIRDIDCIEVACILKEVEENVVKVGLRSKRQVNVAAIARVFYGGGHVKAAGCTIHDNVDNARSLILNQITSELR